MRKEIGSEFWDIPLNSGKSNVVPKDTRWFLSGRNALCYVIADIKKKYEIKSVALPSWCCDSMILPFIEAGFRVEFYDVFIKENILKITMNVSSDVILVMDYFGYTSENDYSDYPGIVIRDITHGMFSNIHSDAEYYFGSLRKWCGFWTGGVAWSQNEFDTNIEIIDSNEKYIELRKQAMREKKNYIQGKIQNKDYLELFYCAEEILDSNIHNIQKASDRDTELVPLLDVDEIKKKRLENARVLTEELNNIVLFKEVKEKDCPLFVPILLEKRRDELRKLLIQNEIYCPMHWPISQLHRLERNTKAIYDMELSLICDQRYSISDMERICTVIKKGI